MPFLTVHTNTTIENKDAFLQEAAAFIANELHKPINYVIVSLDVNDGMIFGGKTEIKSALVEMKSIGFANKALLAQKLTDFLEEKLKLERSFINIHFINMPGADLSIGGNLLG